MSSRARWGAWPVGHALAVRWGRSMVGRGGLRAPGRVGGAAALVADAVGAPECGHVAVLAGERVLGPGVALVLRQHIVRGGLGALLLLFVLPGEQLLRLLDVAAHHLVGLL